MPCGEHEDAQSRSGRALFESINVFAELMENCRFKDLATSVLASFNKGARVGRPDEQLLHRINAERLQITSRFASMFSKGGPLHYDKRPEGHKILCLAPTWKVVNEINDAAFENLRRTNQHYRMWATHTEETKGPVNKEEAAKLSALFSRPGGSNKSSHSFNYLDIAIGSRVQMNTNVATNLGTCNIYLPCSKSLIKSSHVGCIKAYSAGL